MRWKQRIVRSTYLLRIMKDLLKRSPQRKLRSLNAVMTRTKAHLKISRSFIRFNPINSSTIIIYYIKFATGTPTFWDERLRYVRQVNHLVIEASPNIDVVFLSKVMKECPEIGRISRDVSCDFVQIIGDTARRHVNAFQLQPRNLCSSQQDDMSIFNFLCRPHTCFPYEHVQGDFSYISSL